MAGLEGCATAATWAASAAPVGRFTSAMLIWPRSCVRPGTAGAGSLAARPESLSGAGLAAKALCGRNSLHWRLRRGSGRARQPGAGTVDAKESQSLSYADLRVRPQALRCALQWW